MQDILEYILKNITTVPADVAITSEEAEGLPAQAGTTNYIVTVNPADVGRIIGKEGKVIKAIRTIMRVIAIQRGVHVRVSIVSENAPIDSGTDEVVASAPAEPVAEPVAVAENPDNLTVEV